MSNSLLWVNTRRYIEGGSRCSTPSIEANPRGKARARRSLNLNYLKKITLVKSSFWGKGDSSSGSSNSSVDFKKDNHILKLSKYYLVPLNK